jgi:hypothetical protein
LESIKELRKICIKKHKKGVTKPHIWATLFARRVSIYITWLLVKYTKISANQVTIWQLVVSLVGLGFLCSPDVSAAFVGILFLHLGYIFDNVDGEIARYRKSQSINGMFLDFVNHEIIIPLIFSCLSFHLFFTTGEFIYFALSILLLIARNNPVGKARQIMIYYLIEKRNSPTYNISNYRYMGVQDTSSNFGNERSSQKIIKIFVKRIISTVTKTMGYPGDILIVSSLIILEMVFRTLFITKLFIIFLSIYFTFVLILEIYIHLTNRVPERDFGIYVDACVEIKSKEKKIN